MLNRRALCLSLLGGTAGLSACAGGDGPPTRGGAAEVQDGWDMLFISPMGEPFRAKTPAPYPIVAWFKGADANGDGKLDLPEFQADAERFFHTLDLTKDGVIDHREIFYYEHELVPEVLGQSQGRNRSRGSARLWLASNMQMAQMGPGGGGGGAGGGGVMGSGVQEEAPSSSAPKSTGEALIGAAPFGLLSDPEPVQGCNIRLTGLISLADFRIRAEQRFKLLDEANRGYLTLASLPATQAEKLMPRRHGRSGTRDV